MAGVPAKIIIEHLPNKYLEQWFSNGAPPEVARCAANIMRVYFKNEKKPICMEIFFIV
jgi:hypothetical protein